jgi:hypothetical protein
MAYLLFGLICRLRVRACRCAGIRFKTWPAVFMPWKSGATAVILAVIDMISRSFPKNLQNAVLLRHVAHFCKKCSVSTTHHESCTYLCGVRNERLAANTRTHAIAITNHVSSILLFWLKLWRSVRACQCAAAILPVERGDHPSTNDRCQFSIHGISLSRRIA